MHMFFSIPISRTAERRDFYVLQRNSVQKHQQVPGSYSSSASKRIALTSSLSLAFVLFHTGCASASPYIRTRNCFDCVLCKVFMHGTPLMLNMRSAGKNRKLLEIDKVQAEMMFCGEYFTHFSVLNDSKSISLAIFNSCTMFSTVRLN